MTIRLREFGSCTIEMSADDYATLRARYSGKLDLAPTEQSGVYRLSARAHVGRIALPDGRVLVIEPKVEVKNLFYMLCVETGVAHFYRQPIALEEHPEIFTIVLAVLVSEAEKLIAKGVYHDYRPREEALPLVRGRIALEAQISRYGSLNHLHICRFTEPTLDTAENRIVAATLRQAMPLIRFAGERSLLRRARALLKHLGEVAATTRSAALGLLTQVRTHRLNRAYWPLLGLCALVLRGLSLSERAGRDSFASFLIDMPRLFESFLTARLCSGLTAHGLRAVAQRNDYLDVGKRVGIRPDILVYDPSGTIPLLVVDAKYRQPNAAQSDLNRDLYQVSAYMHRYGLSRGMLVYPQWEQPGPGALKLLGTPKEMHIANLDLSLQGPSALDQECSRLAAQVAALSAPVQN